jgi:N-acetyltransferase
MQEPFVGVVATVGLMSSVREVFDAQPTLVGGSIMLRPLVPGDRAAITAAAADPLIWELHPSNDRHRPEVFAAYFDERLASGKALLAIDRLTGEVVGWSSYANVDLERSEVEIGWTFLVRSRWGGATNREMKRLMVDHAFRFLDVVVFLIGVDNARSRRAIEKLGARQRPDKVTASAAPNAVEYAVYELGRDDLT